VRYYVRKKLNNQSSIKPKIWLSSIAVVPYSPPTSVTKHNFDKINGKSPEYKNSTDDPKTYVAKYPS
jgi:hypothetical protein